MQERKTGARQFRRILVANRGEIAVRIMRTASEMGIQSAAVYSEDDSQCLHTLRAHASKMLAGTGAAPYLDAEQIISAAISMDCDAIHPGYGFLSENAAFARRCKDENIVFIGPDPETLALLGDKTRALALAKRCNVPISRSTATLASADEALAFLASLGKNGVMVIKAVGGGGGRGMRLVWSKQEVQEAFKRCQSEALASFGASDVYAEEFVPRARHVEVQIMGDGTGAISHLWERECSIQRRHQKVIEFAPSPALSKEIRARLTTAAVRMARAIRYRNLGTFEFLVGEDGHKFVFIESNPRLQVEHTVTEEITGCDLVSLQIEIALGKTLEQLHMTQKEIPEPKGIAMQLRINTERISNTGAVIPTGGMITCYEPPTGSGLRTDSFVYSGYATSPRFDSLLAKLIVHSPRVDFAALWTKAYQALCEFRIEGIETNLHFLQNLLCHPDFQANHLHTRFVEERLDSLTNETIDSHPKRFFTTSLRVPVSLAIRQAGASIDRSDPLSILDHGKTTAGGPASTPRMAEDADALETLGKRALIVRAAMQGTVIAIDVEEGDLVGAGSPLITMEAMKMEHAIIAPRSGLVLKVGVSLNDAVMEGDPLILIEARDVEGSETTAQSTVDLTVVRPDLEELHARQSLLTDAARPEAVSKRHKRGQRTARENVADLFDEGTFLEYGGFVVAAQHHRRSMDDLIRNTPGDGLIAGYGKVNGELFEGEAANCAVLACDYTVLAGTLGENNHKKFDRLLDVAHRGRMPIVLFAEGGGGRPGDMRSAGSHETFTVFPELSGEIPLIGVNSGYCFAANAALLGCCDVIIATRNSNIGMGGPAVIEGGGLGAYRPQEIGPAETQVRNGVIDVLVADESEAVRVAKKYLGYFQGKIRNWKCVDQRILRGMVPLERRKAYDIRPVIAAFADQDSVLELRREFGLSLITSFVRLEGQPFGLIANNPMHLGGAIDSDAADKGARFMQLCDTFRIPVISFCDTPGIMVGPEAEKTALVRHASRMMLAGANLSVPFFSIVLRKAYGIGKVCMVGGGSYKPLFSISWPTGEFGKMNLEGQVKLGNRKELEAISDVHERKRRYEQLVNELYMKGKAITKATEFGIDNVIDPADTRHWVLAGMSAARLQLTSNPRGAYVDSW